MNKESELLVIDPEEVNLRLDQILTRRFQGHFSRTYFQNLIEQSLVLVNGEPVKKRMKPQAGDEVEIEFVFDQTIDLVPEPIPLDILYEDSDLLAINKPAGMVVHPAPGNWTKTFVNALVYHCQELLKQDDRIRPGIVHRLDKDTSGVLIAAKNAEVQRRLIDAFAKRQVEKWYGAIVWGNPGNQIISAPIGRSPTNRQKMAIVPTGKEARSRVETVRSNREMAYVRIALETGRTHQIRVHLSSIGNPVVGDPLYGRKQANDRLKVERQLLHAESISLLHPMTKKPLLIQAPYPEDFKRILEKI